MWAQSGFAEGKNQESVRNGGNRIIWSPTTRINSSYIKEIFSDNCVINLNLIYNKIYEIDFNRWEMGETALFGRQPNRINNSYIK